MSVQDSMERIKALRETQLNKAGYETVPKSEQSSGGAIIRRKSSSGSSSSSGTNTSSEQTPVQVIRIPYIVPIEEKPKDKSVGDYIKMILILADVVRNRDKLQPGHAGGERISTSEYQQELEDARQNIRDTTQIKYDLEDIGKNLKSFDPTTPVDIEGVTYPGSDVEYKVSGYNPFVNLYKNVPSSIVERGFGLFPNKELTMTSEQYDKYQENLGNYYLRESKNIDADKLNDILGVLNKQYSDTTDWRPGTEVIKYDPFYYKFNESTGRLVKGKTEGVTSPGTTSYLPDFEYPGAQFYHSTRKNIEDRGAIGKFAIAMTPTNFAGIPATVEYLLGNTQKAYDIEVESVYNTSQVQPFNLNPLDSRSFTSFYLGSPLGVIGMAAVSYGGSSALAPTMGSLSASHPIGFAVASRTLGIGVKTAIVTYGTYDFVTKVSEGDIGKAFGGAARLGLTYYGVSKAGQYGMTRINPKTGLTYFQGTYDTVSGLPKTGAVKGQYEYNMRMFDKDAPSVINTLSKQGGVLTPYQETSFMTAWKAGALSTKMSMDYRLLSYAALHKPQFIQPELIWDESKIELISNQRFIDSMKNLWYSGKSKLIGGFGSNKPLTRDVDVQFSPYAKAKWDVVLKEMGYGLDTKGIDWHYLQKPGTMVTQYGGVSMPSYKYASGGEGIRWYEQTSRLLHSGWNLAHSGRVKDLPEGLRMIQQMYPTGLPSNIGFSMNEYSSVTGFLSEHPLIMSSTASSLYYSPNISEGFKNIQSSFYKKTMGWSFKTTASNIKNIVDVGDISFSRTGIVPPSISFSPSSIISSVNLGASSIPIISRSNNRSISISSISNIVTSPIISSGSSYKSSVSFSPSSSLSKYFSSINKSTSSKSISSIIKSSSVSSVSKSISGSSSSISPSMSSSISSSRYTSSSVPIGFILPGMSMYGRGSHSYKGGILNPRYRFREFKIPSLDKLIKGVKLS